MITYYFRTIKDESLKTISDIRTGIWVHVVSPTDAEVEKLVQDFALDADIVRDARDFFEVPRMERAGTLTYFFTRYPYDDTQEDSDTAPLLIVVGESFVLTIAVREVVQFTPIFEGSLPVYTTQKAKFFIQIMDLLTRSFDARLVRLRKGVQRDRARLRRIGPREIERLVEYEVELNSMIDALIPTNTWLQQVTNGTVMQLYSDDVALMEDLLIANNQVVGSARSVLKTIQNVRGASEAILTSRLNNALRILTVLTIILTVPLVVASLYGMNVPLPGQESVFAFPVLVVVVCSVMAGLTYYFKRNNWF
jgi:magnesium transporter